MNSRVFFVHLKEAIYQDDAATVGVLVRKDGDKTSFGRFLDWGRYTTSKQLTRAEAKTLINRAGVLKVQKLGK